MSHRLLVSGGDLVLPDRLLPASALLVEDGRIAAVGDGASAPDAEVIDARGCTVLPGLVDLHVHGARGLWTGLHPGAVEALSSLLPRFGVTAFLPTAAGLPWEELLAALPALRREIRAPFPGARPLGLHLEGPFLHPRRCGALPPESLCDPRPDRVAALLEAGGRDLSIVTLAPELPGALEAVETLSEEGVTVSMGHTEADFDTVVRACDRGLSHVCHCYNAMRRFAHRAPGPVEAALLLDSLSVEVIADSRHVHAPGLRILLGLKPPGKVCAVSDATALGAGASRFRVGGRTLEVAGGVVRDTETGALGGSAEPLLRGYRMLRDVGLPPWEAVGPCSLHPARVAGVGDRKGSLEPGKDADLFLLGPDGAVAEVLVEGRRLA